MQDLGFGPDVLDHDCEAWAAVPGPKNVAGDELFACLANPQWDAERAHELLLVVAQQLKAEMLTFDSKPHPQQGGHSGGNLRPLPSL